VKDLPPARRRFEKIANPAARSQSARIVRMSTARLAKDSDRSAIVETVVAAFVNDPAFRFFFGTDDGYRSKASAFVEYLFDKRIVHRAIWVTGLSDAVSLWSPPDHMLTDEHRKYEDDLQSKMKQSIGAQAVHNLETYDAAVEKALPTEPYWYLGILAAHPTRAAKGAGRNVMQAGLSHVRSVGGLAALETTNERNPDYYERNGWKLASTIESATPSTIWVLTTR
jgi:GNAT superfamily N-acetyltransferase